MDSDKNLVAEQIKAVHAKIIANTSYKYESSNRWALKDQACTVGNEGHVRTAYGALVKHESLCEGYSRAMKVVLDRLNIPSVLVYGTYVYTEDQLEEHMWNYVQIDGKWYAIDSTFDDPTSTQNILFDYVQDSEKPAGNDGYENNQFLLVGDCMMAKHRANGVISESDFEFEYPYIESNSYSSKLLTAEDADLKVYFSDDVEYDGVALGEFQISYKGMGIQKAKEQGLYFIAKWYSKSPTDPSFNEKNESHVTPWVYEIDDIDVSGIIQSSDNSFIIATGHVPYVEFAVTDVAPAPYLKTMPGGEKLTDMQRAYNTRYHGTEDGIIASTPILANTQSNYKRAPQLAYANPYFGTCLEPARTYHITFGHDQKLKPNGEEIKLVWRGRNGVSSVENSEVKNFKYTENDGYYKFEFDFTASEMWGDMGEWYYFQVKGLVGVDSEREPVLTKVGVNKRKPCLTSQRLSHNWDFFARPTYVSSNLSVPTGNGTEELLDNNSAEYKITLVTTQVADAKAVAMRDLLDTELGKDVSVGGDKEVLATTMWDIDPIVCNKSLLEFAKGDKITISMGFPEGYGPKDAGVVFKAYHYKEGSGGIQEIEEIPCVVTQYGLLITCNSFSPFLVAAVKGTQLVQVEKEDGTKEFVEDTSKTVTMVPNENNGTIEANGMDETNTFKLKEGESKDVTITAKDGYVLESVTVNGTEKVTGTGVETQTITFSYQDLKGLPQNGVIANVKYVAKATQEKEVRDGQTAVIEKEPTVLENPTFDIALDTNAVQVTEGDEFTVTGKISNATKGLLVVGGKLEFDKDILEIKQNGITGKNNWSFSDADYNLNNFKFITDTNNAITNETAIFEITFKVKEGVTSGETTISLKEVTGGTGENINGVAYAENIDLTLQIQEKPEPENITSDDYQVNLEENRITNIPINTSIATFKTKVVANRELVFKDKTGATITDESALVKTGMKVSIGEVELSLVVSADIDGDGILSTNDIAKIKLHYIETENLTGLGLLAADLDNDGNVTTNDLAQMKLNYIELP